MRFLTPFYALLAHQEGFELQDRRSSAALAKAQCAWRGPGLDLEGLPGVLGGEACRLIAQWAFEAQDAACLSMPLHSEALAAWAPLGARVDGDRLVLGQADFAAANRALGCKGAAWLERSLPSLKVVCVALINAQDEVLLAQRPEGKSFAGLWEFPGGKVERGESPELALCRELGEELGIRVWNSCLSPLTFVSHAYEDFHLSLLAYVCYKFEGEPQGREGQRLKWWPPKALEARLMPPANAALVHAVQDLLA